MKKTINFNNVKLLSIFNEYSRNNNSFISGCDSDFSKKIGFLAYSILNDQDGSEIDSDISEMIIYDENEPIDLIWTDINKESRKNIVFLRWIENDIKNIEPFFDEIDHFCENVNYHISNFNDKNINYIEKNHKINAILEQIFMEAHSSELTEFDEINKFFIYIAIKGSIKYQKKDKANILKIIKQRNNAIMKNKKIEIKLFFEDDIIEFATEKNEFKICIDYHKVEFDENSNILKFDENSNIKAIVCNMNASSINKLWKIYSNNLLGLNLRLHITNKAIDRNLEESMKPSNNELFWFKNNGLVIICEKYKITNNELELFNFSIVNGGQTTYSIGQLDESFFYENDFFVLTKIIAIPNMGLKPSKEVYELSNSIAEATNQQKPIQNVDLISNLPIVKDVKRMFQQEAKIKFFIETRRGEKLAKIDDKKFISIKAEQLLQIQNGFSRIIPGTCVNGKNKLYSEPKKIEDSFDEIRNNIHLYEELICLYKTHSELKKVKKLEQFFRDDVMGKKFIKHGQYFMIASIKLIFIIHNDSAKINELQIKMDKWKMDSLASTRARIQFQDKIAKWIEDEFRKLNITRILKQPLSMDNLDWIELGYITIIKDEFSHLLDFAFSSWNSRDDKLISNFVKQNTTFYDFFIKHLFKIRNDERSWNNFSKFFNLGDKK
ncbi:MAG: AIPR family protein [Metamycoplasmataceae bacterium]